ncbi:Uncharacterized protein Adt_31459 [Abeliophyllum distichum]|uniref:Uncharacterized protein n=1 Tax=Abeliophyllum distichum TaxID=126358 RepID=A0ABD1REB1_9LAMI
MHAIDTNQDQAEAKVYLAELIKGDTYACPIQAKSEMPIKNEPAKEENKKTRTFSFDITKADIIFDRLYKDKQIKLSDKHKLPKPEQIKGRITFESKKKMAVDENPFPQLVDVNMGAKRSRATIESKVAKQNTFEDGEEDDTKALKEEPLKEEPLKGECVGKSKFEHRKDDEDDDDVG